MIFNSVTYLLFLVITVSLYWVLPYRVRLITLFLASLIFYAFWRVEFVPVMMASVIVDYFVAGNMQQASADRKKVLLTLSLVFNLGLLFYFKYLIFFSQSAVGLANLFGLEMDPVILNIILPLGISFYTFQTISYTVDVYRGVIKPEKDFILYSCYVTFFPQLVAGPILRAGEVIHQLRERARFNIDDIALGVKRIMYGLFLKVVLADNIAPLVDAGFQIPVESMSAIDVWTLAFLFGFQIYFDFSAYSHIAIGSARLMGIHFPENFNFPYAASSPRVFWQRWHISLSSWIRDYLYLPLLGVKKFRDQSHGGLGKAVTGHKKTQVLFLTWGIMGLWHGANWTFLLWGLYHAMVIVIYRALSPLAKKLSSTTVMTVGVLLTLPVMMLSWIPFRADSIGNALNMWAKIGTPSAYLSLNMRENVYLIAALLLALFFLTKWIKDHIEKVTLKWPIMNLVLETALYAVLVPFVFVFIRPVSQFIYFQF